MIKTEAKRRDLRPSLNLQPPKNVSKALRHYDSELELVWNDEGQWEIYRLKQKGITKDEDILHWQMSVPQQGSIITVGIVSWLKRFDSTCGGNKTKEELVKEFFKNMKEINYKQKIKRQKELDEAQYAYSGMLHRYAVEREQISVPTLVGMNKKTGKKIYAVKKAAKR